MKKIFVLLLVLMSINAFTKDINVKVQYLYNRNQKKEIDIDVTSEASMNCTNSMRCGGTAFNIEFLHEDKKSLFISKINETLTEYMAIFFESKDAAEIAKLIIEEYALNIIIYHSDDSGTKLKGRSFLNVAIDDLYIYTKDGEVVSIRKLIQHFKLKRGKLLKSL